MAKQEFSIPSLSVGLKTEADAYLLLEKLRWGGTPEACPKCGTIGRCYFLNPANGATRKTRTGSISERRVWKCGSCRKQFSVLTDTIFHGTKISIRTWLMVIFEVCSSKNSISAAEVARKYEITNESAWHLVHRIREAMKREPVAGLLRGAVQADETWIGGNPANRHHNDDREKLRSSGSTDKQPVFALVHYETREVRSMTVEKVTARNLGEKIYENLDLPNTWLQTDSAKAYYKVGPEAANHDTVNHMAGEYKSPAGGGTNLVEGFFSQLKRSLDGTHHHVSIGHLNRYLAQFDFMFSNCKKSDSERMRILLSQVAGRRLTYKPLSGMA
ncbi:IS1595 family transposase [soil metagenome]